MRVDIINYKMVMTLNSNWMNHVQSQHKRLINAHLSSHILCTMFLCCLATAN